MTHTYAVLDVSKAAYDEIRAKLAAVGYEHAFEGKGDREVIDMHGIALHALPISPTERVRPEEWDRLSILATEMIRAGVPLLSDEEIEAHINREVTPAPKYDPSLLPRFVNDPAFADVYRDLDRGISRLKEMGIEDATIALTHGKVTIL